MTQSSALTHFDLGIVIVSWNVKDLLQRCLESVETSLSDSQITYRLVVVDNASHDGTVAMVREQFPRVQLVENDTNRGFSGGTNDGLRALGLLNEQDNRRGPRYVMLLNPDTEVVGDALSHLVHYLDTHPHALVVGPQLRYGDGTLQSSRRRFPSLMALFWESTLLELWWPGNPWARRYRMEGRPPTGEQNVGWLVGAALLVRSSAVEQVGGLDEGFFMYSEELEWQERITRAFKSKKPQVVYLPGAVIIHHEGRSSEQNLLRRQINFNRSKLRYTGIRYGRLVELMLRLFLLTTYLIQIVIEAAKWVLGHKRRMRAARVRQYVRIVLSGL